MNPESHTVNTFIEDEVEELSEGILVFIDENVGDAGVHLLQQPRLQLLCAIPIL